MALNNNLLMRQDSAILGNPLTEFSNHPTDKREI
jgi:hypothetical protein